MTLPDLTALKGYLRIDSPSEDAVLAAILASATAMVARYCERPLTLELRTFVDVAYTERAFGRVYSLMLPVWPVHAGDVMADPPIAAPVVTDNDLDVVDAADYRIDMRSGVFYGTNAGSFPNGPYVIIATVGLGALPNYASEVEPVLGQAILDVAADLYANRTPSAQSETAGGSASTTWRADTESGLPARAEKMLRAYKPVGIA